MKYTKSLVVLAMAALVSLSSIAGNEGGGGGGICTGRKCITLAQAGFRVIEDESFSYIPSSTIDELDSISSQLKKASVGLYTRQVIGGPGDIVFIKEVQADLVKKFLKEYQRVLTENQEVEMAGKVELFGFTSDGKTYLIKDKFDALNERGQALLLIHESSLRVNKVSLEDALRFDGALVDFLEAIQNNERPDYISLYHSLKNFDLMNEDHRRSYLLAELALKYDVDLNTLFQNPDVHGITLSYVQLLRLNEVIPGISDYLTSGAISYHHKYQSRVTILANFVEHVYNLAASKRNGKMTVTNELWKAFLETQDKQSIAYIWSNKCGGFDDLTTYLAHDEVTMGSKDQTPAAVGFFWCKPHDGLYDNYRLGVPKVNNWTFFQNLSGLELNLEGPVTCSLDKKTLSMECK